MPLTDQEYEAVASPIEDALGLPNRAYTCESFLNEETKRVFSNSWIGIAFTTDVTKPGDIYPVTAAGQPLIVVHGQDNQIRVFHNVCRHRGVKMVDAPCADKKLIVCPYHAWSYTLDGALKATPHFNGIKDNSRPSLDGSSQNLFEVRCGIWNHVIMVNLSGNAALLDKWTAKLDARWEPFDIDNMVPGGNMTFEFEANWKLVLENYLESYHLPAVHPVLDSFSPMKDHVLVVDDLFMGQLSLNYRPNDDGKGLPRFPNLPAEREAAGEYLLLFPNLMVSVTPDHYRVTIVTPRSAGKTHQRWQFFYVGEESADARFKAARNGVMERITSYTLEDIDILERLQAGRKSERYDGGRFSPFHETTTHRFQKLVAKSLNEDLQPNE
jgi:choline monooxygenase